MADDKLRRPQAQSGSAETCEQCDKHPATRCPSCPRGPGKPHDEGFGALIAADPVLGRVQLRNARAALALARCPEGHPAYPALAGEYVAAGLELMLLRFALAGRAPAQSVLAAAAAQGVRYGSRNLATVAAPA